MAYVHKYIYVHIFPFCQQVRSKNYVKCATNDSITPYLSSSGQSSFTFYLYIKVNLNLQQCNFFSTSSIFFLFFLARDLNHQHLLHICSFCWIIFGAIFFTSINVFPFLFEIFCKCINICLYSLLPFFLIGILVSQNILTNIGR